ncbi:MAG TPA: NADH-quinone oxidoreductase subunit NuoG, partial [Fimbriimonadaceae bacterium]|nr:NADH-quinone oxidoreductase subunit NuoG [Fimbriimonadaceae bacterium]
MAAVASTETVKIKVNNVDLDVPKGELIVESVKRLGLEIPIFCYHSRMKPVGMCRMCLVEVGFVQPDGSVRMMPKPQAACTLGASEGMAIVTDSELVHRDRRGVLEFLLVNHPLDCPICDRGGECPLQNNTIFYGPSTSRFVEMKRHLPKAFPLSQYVTLDLERCIQCGRCVRFTEEISGDSQLAFRFRGANMTPSTFELRDFQSKFSGNVIEICPVGALTNAKYRFRARPWDLETKPGICTLCSNGCSIWFDYRVGKLARVNGRTNEAVNEEWTCDRGKFGHDFYNSETRLTKPLVRQGDALVEADWSDAYGPILEAFQGGKDKVAALAGPMVSNEGLFLLQKLFREGFGSNNLDHRFEKNLVPYGERLSAKMGVGEVQSTIDSFELANSILVFGTSLADEEPILFLRVRKAWFKHGARVVVAHHAPTDADSFAHVLLRYREGTAGAVANGLLKLLIDSGKAKVPAATADAVKAFTPEQVESISGVPASSLKAAAEVLAGASIATTRGLYNLADGTEVAETLAGIAMTTGGAFNLYARGANEQGAADLGFLPDTLPGGGAAPKAGKNTHEILKAAADGKMKALWLVGWDPFD